MARGEPTYFLIIIKYHSRTVKVSNITSIIYILFQGAVQHSVITPKSESAFTLLNINNDYEILIVCQLNFIIIHVSLRRLALGFFFLIRLRKVLATLACTFLLYGGLNQMMFLLLFLFACVIALFLQ